MSEFETPRYESFTVQQISDDESSNGLDEEKKMEKSRNKKKTIVFKEKVNLKANLFILLHLNCRL